jgi:hypothetical protein
MEDCQQNALNKIKCVSLKKSPRSSPDPGRRFRRYDCFFCQSRRSLWCEVPDKKGYVIFQVTNHRLHKLHGFSRNRIVRANLQNLWFLILLNKDFLYAKSCAPLSSEAIAQNHLNDARIAPGYRVCGQSERRTIAEGITAEQVLVLKI